MCVYVGGACGLMCIISGNELRDPNLNPVRGWVGCLRGVMIKSMYYGIVVSEFELQTRYYANFRTNTLRKVMNPLILSSMG